MTHGHILFPVTLSGPTLSTPGIITAGGTVHAGTIHGDGMTPSGDALTGDGTDPSIGVGTGLAMEAGLIRATISILIGTDPCTTLAVADILPTTKAISSPQVLQAEELSMEAPTTAPPYPAGHQQEGMVWTRVSAQAVSTTPSVRHPLHIATTTTEAPISIPREEEDSPALHPAQEHSPIPAAARASLPTTHEATVLPEAISHLTIKHQKANRIHPAEATTATHLAAEAVLAPAAEAAVHLAEAVVSPEEEVLHMAVAAASPEAVAADAETRDMPFVSPTYFSLAFLAI